MVTPNSRNLLP
jgi:hypothetical protein